MDFKIGELVTRNSHSNDMVFRIVEIKEDEVCILKGINIRLIADSPLSDLEKYDEKEDIEEDQKFLERISPLPTLDRCDYFYLPGKILHIDADEDYLNRCLTFYEQNNLWAVGRKEMESEVSGNIRELLNEYNPSIVVITGHDAYYKRKGDINDMGAYRNSQNFVDAIKEARKYEKSHEKLIIIAGACQSNYEELIKAGANFASSPKRVNIHALDPAIIASKLSLSEVTEDIDLKDILENTKYGTNGIGGIKTKGTMYVGYPRQEEFKIITKIKEELNDHIGDTVTLNYNLGRNKYETYEVVIKDLYNNVFVVQLANEERVVKSFSYSDIITKTIKIDY